MGHFYHGSRSDGYGSAVANAPEPVGGTRHSVRRAGAAPKSGEVSRTTAASWPQPTQDWGEVSSTRGSQTVNSAPPSGLAAAVTQPPWELMVWATMDRPNPVPGVLRERSER